MTNYFDFIGIAESFEIDLAELRLLFIANSKKYHPDFHTLKSEEEQERILEMSTLNNEAWKTLSDPIKRMAHILSLKGYMPEEGKAQVPQEFLMDMMDLNEALMELEFEADDAKKKEVLMALESQELAIHQEGQDAMTSWNIEKKDDFLETVRDYYLKLKYINRIKEGLKG